MAGSQVAVLRQQIESICFSMNRGLSGLASGTARHTFIVHKHMELQSAQEQLAHVIGDEKSIVTMCEIYERSVVDG
ncbi:hypothetical protein [Dictyobacter kobayashii]|uniref:PhoU domain-containing protein n=1 Tax=Dictyobacter kobayashii TaxID=2014872 RepID=A0A402API8_9CHLR|nr:hypothetical protein [Dictyobacter kobayashii]GCE20890.1 hypothetical protein KDK_46900 [Dictyobacter kobayashii]